MSRNITEKDWKFLRTIETEMISTLCEKINREALNLLQSSEISEHEKYMKLYHHVEEADQLIANCFNDWRRSNIRLKIPLLRRHGLLTDEHLENMSDDVKNYLESLEEINDNF